MLEKRIESYSKGISYLANTKVKGRLIVIEGPDASGRSTQITMLTSKLEADGHADFADQLENKIIPALHSGYVVLADRYIYTLLARDAVRGISTTWSHNLFGFAMKPHLVFYLDVDPNELVHRVFQKNSSLDYYESGTDLGLSDNMLKSFLIYQGLIAKQFQKMQRKYGLVPINGNRSMMEIQKDLQDKIDYFLKSY